MQLCALKTLVSVIRNHCICKCVQLKPVPFFFSSSKFLVFVGIDSFWNVTKNSFYSISYFRFISCQFWTIKVPNCGSIFKMWPFPNQFVHNFLSFPFNVYFVTFKSGSLARLGLIPMSMLVDLVLRINSFWLTSERNDGGESFIGRWQKDVFFFTKCLL